MALEDLKIANVFQDVSVHWLHVHFEEGVRPSTPKPEPR